MNAPTQEELYAELIAQYHARRVVHSPQDKADAFERMVLALAQLEIARYSVRPAPPVSLRRFEPNRGQMDETVEGRYVLHADILPILTTLHNLYYAEAKRGTPD